MIPSLNYSLLTPLWSENLRQPVVDAVLSGDLYVKHTDGIVCKFDRMGTCEEIGYSSGKIAVYDSNLYAIDADKLVVNVLTTNIRCRDFVVNDAGIFAVVDFLDMSQIVRYNFSHEEILRSKLFPSIPKLKESNNSLIAICDNRFFELDYEFNVMTDICCQDLLDVVKNDEIFIVSGQTNTQLSTRDSQLDFSGEYKTSFFEEFNYILTDKLHILRKDKKIREIDADLFLPFQNETEHFCIANNNKLHIFETETGIMTWTHSLPTKIDIFQADERGLFVFTKEKLHYFGVVDWFLDL